MVNVKCRFWDCSHGKSDKVKYTRLPFNKPLRATSHCEWNRWTSCLWVGLSSYVLHFLALHWISVICTCTLAVTVLTVHSCIIRHGLAHGPPALFIDVILGCASYTVFFSFWVCLGSYCVSLWLFGIYLSYSMPFWSNFVSFSVLIWPACCSVMIFMWNLDCFA